MHHCKNRPAVRDARRVLQRHFKPQRLAAIELFILRGGVLPQRDRPSSRAAEHAIARVKRIVLHGVHVFRQAGAELAERRPPVIVVAAQQQDRARQLGNFAQIVQRVAKLHRPGDIPRNQHDILRLHAALPVRANPLKMPLPMRAENIHRLFVAARQMQIADCKNAHRSPLVSELRNPLRRPRRLRLPCSFLLPAKSARRFPRAYPPAGRPARFPPSRKRPPCRG